MGTVIARERRAREFFHTGRELSFEVFGLPAPQGSKKGFVKQDRRSGRAYAVVVDDDEEGLMIWRQMVIGKAREARIAGNFAAPLAAASVYLEFYFPRPAGHFGVKGLLASAPLVKVTKPDLDKLVRAVYDSLTQAYVVIDDNAIVYSEEFKDFGEPSLFARVRELALRSGQVPLELPGPDARS